MQIALGTADDGNLWDVKRAAEFLGMKQYTIRSWVRQGRLPAIVIGRVIRFDPNKLREWLKRYWR